MGNGKRARARAWAWKCPPPPAASALSGLPRTLTLEFEGRMLRYKQQAFGLVT